MQFTATQARVITIPRLGLEGLGFRDLQIRVLLVAGSPNISRHYDASAIPECMSSSVLFAVPLASTGLGRWVRGFGCGSAALRKPRFGPDLQPLV